MDRRHDLFLFVIPGYGPGGEEFFPASGQKVYGKFVGGGVPDAPRRAQDPSLQSKPEKGCNGKVAGGIYAAPTGQPIKVPSLPSPQRHVDLILDGKAVDRQLCHRYGQPLGKCAAVEP